MSLQSIDLGSLAAAGAGVTVDLSTFPSINLARVHVFGVFIGIVGIEVSPDGVQWFDAVDDADAAMLNVALVATEALTVALAETGGVGTLTTDTAHNLKIGDTFELAGQTPAGWVGTYVVLTVPSNVTTTFTKSTEADTTVHGTWVRRSQRFAKTIKGDAEKIRANVTAYTSGTAEIRVTPDTGFRIKVTG